MGLTLPFFGGTGRRKRSQIISVDLGSRTTKAVRLERRGDLFALTRYAMLDAPIYDKKISVNLLADHLHAVTEALGGNVKYISASVGFSDTVIRQVELPQMPVDEMRAVLKVNHKNYFQQELPSHAFDCHIIPPRLAAPAGKNADPGRAPGRAMLPDKLKVIVAAAKQQLVLDFMQAAEGAGLVADALVPSLFGPINAFELAMPGDFQTQTVALVDIGFKHTSVCVLDRGELATNRVISLGGDHLTASLAETKGISYSEAEGIKVGMAAEVQADLQVPVTQLGREIRASLDFFEHQQDRPVSHVYVSGGTSRSELIVQMLNSEIMTECKPWNPTGFLQLGLPGPQAVELEHVAPQLTVAIGTAMAAY